MDSFNDVNSVSLSLTTPLAQRFPWLSEWHSKGVLRAIDQQWIVQLSDHANETSTSLLVAGSLCSAYLGAGHICLDLAAVWHSSVENLPLESLREVLATEGIHSVEDWCQSLANSALVGEGDSASPTPLVLEQQRLYLFRYYHYQQDVLQYLQTQLNKPAFALDKHLLSALFDTDNDVLDWQKVAVANAASLAFAVISGGPGTGKTTTVTKLLALLVAQASQQGQLLRIALAAPTGKAAARLTESITKAKAHLPFDADITAAIPEQASTLHRLLGSDFGRSRFKHNRQNPLHLDVLLVDEVSMVDLPMMAKLIAALPAHCRLILLGDKDQLASVEAGSILGDMTFGIENAYFQPSWAQHLAQLSQQPLAQFANPQAPLISRALTLLRTSYRFSQDSGIGHLAKAINSGNKAAVVAVLQQGFSDIHWQLTQPKQGQLDLPSLAKGYDEYWQAVRNKAPIAELYQVFSSYQILTAVRQGEWGVENINSLLEQYFYQRGRIQNLHTWYPGKAVMLTRNDKGLGLFNGDIGLCMPDDEGRLRVWFIEADGNFKGLLPSRLSEFEAVFAMTVHKSQGSEFEHVTLLLPTTPSPVLTRELIYTGITRAKQTFTLWGPELLLMEAIDKRVQRHSGLMSKLWPDEQA